MEKYLNSLLMEDDKGMIFIKLSEQIRSDVSLGKSLGSAFNSTVVG